MTAKPAIMLGLMVFASSLSIQVTGDHEIDFSVYSTGNQVRIHWTAQHRSNIANFTLERSRDGKSFQALKVVNDDGGDPESAEFVETDQNPLLGWSYYRIKHQDVKGAEFYTHIVPVFFGLDRMRKGTVIAPEELGSSELTTFLIEDFNNVDAVFVIRDAQGMEYYYETVIHIVNQNIVLRATDTLPAGLYTVTACSRNQLVGLPLTVQ